MVSATISTMRKGGVSSLDRSKVSRPRSGNGKASLQDCARWRLLWFLCKSDYMLFEVMDQSTILRTLSLSFCAHSVKISSHVVQLLGVNISDAFSKVNSPFYPISLLCIAMLKLGVDVSRTQWSVANGHCPRRYSRLIWANDLTTWRVRKPRSARRLHLERVTVLLFVFHFARTGTFTSNADCPPLRAARCAVMSCSNAVTRCCSSRLASFNSRMFADMRRYSGGGSIW